MKPETRSLCTMFVAILACLLAVLASADASAGETKSFVACPVYRDADAGPKSGCWLATDRTTGLRFDVSGALNKPQIGRSILVEGLVSNGDPSQCGAPILEPVRVSLLDESCPRHLIPAEGHPGRRFGLPAEVMQPLSVPRQLPQGPFIDRHYTVLFNFGSDFLNYQYSEIILEKAALYIRASQPRAVEIIGFAATDAYQVSGRELRESLSLAEARARQVALALERLLRGEQELSLRWQGSPAPVQDARAALAEESKRRVEIRVLLD